MFKLIGKNTNAPTLLMDIHAYINLLTLKIKFANLIHGKSSFRFVESVRYNIYDRGTCLLLFNHKVYVKQ